MKFVRYKKSGIKLDSRTVEPPPGTIIVFAGSGTTPPQGWLKCDGSVVAKSSYSALHAAITTTFNTGGEAGTDFRLPDMRGRIPIGAGTGAGGASSGSGVISGGSALTARSVGPTAIGAETVTLTSAESGLPAHSHSISESNHDHSITGNGNHNHTYKLSLAGGFAAGGTGVAYLATTGGISYTSTGPQQSKTVTVVSSTSNITDGSGSPSGANKTASNGSAATSSHTNTQPSIVMQYLIKT